MTQEYLTTTQAAKFCNVTRFTVRNWVNSGKLKSGLTAGGHRRINKSDLIKFINDNRLSKINPHDTRYFIPQCWEFRNFKNSGDHDCVKCLVFKEKANKCFLLVRDFGAEKIQCQYDCQYCEYLQKYYPKEKKIIEKMKKASRDTRQIMEPKRSLKKDKPATFNGNKDRGIIFKGVYTSGKYIASVKNVFNKKDKRI